MGGWLADFDKSRKCIGQSDLMPSEDPELDNEPVNQVFGYEAAFYALPDPVFIYNHSLKRIMNANDAAVRRYGYTVEQFQKMGPWELEEPYEEVEVVEKIDKLKARGSVVYLAEHRSASGDCFPAEIHTIYHNYNGMDLFVAICREIGDRLESEERLKKAETHYRAIFENVVSLICVANLRTAMFLDVNPAFEKLLGYSRAELLDRSFMEFVHPDDVARTSEIIKMMKLEGSLSISFQNRYRCKSGRYVWLDWSPQPLPEHDVVYAVARDISEQKWFEERLRLQNQRMLLHVEQTPLGVIEWSLDFRVKAWNHAAERIFGYSKDEAIGQRGAFILPPGSTEEIDNLWAQLVANSGGERSLNSNLHKNGSELVCEWHNTPLVNEEGQVIGVASLVMDVTEQEHRKLELEQAKESAEKANRAKSEFLSMMSHELRTPLNSIVGPCELINQQIDDPDLKPLVDVMRTSSSHLLDLINSILDLSKIESGSMEINLERFPAAAFFEQRLLPLEASARNKGLEFSLQNNISPCSFLETDGRVLLQALFNIVGNAVKFTEKGSITVHIEAIDEMVRIDVVDTGIGIERELQDKLFEPFRQGPVALSKEQRGSGLGLAVTKRLVELLGGTISFTSVPQNGSTFSIVVPSIKVASELVATSDQELVASTTSDTPKRTLLLVEDEPNNQIVNSALLKFLNYPHDIASTGEEAVELWKENRYPIVLMDVKLPGIDGVEACRQIKALAGAAPVVVIAQSAHALTEQRKEFLRNGMDDYLSKPISLESLKESLENATELVEASG